MSIGQIKQYPETESDKVFADITQHTLRFSLDVQGERLILALLDDPWVQRLRDISQTANTKLVYIFAEHSRFGHSLGVACMACRLMDKLAKHHHDDVEEYRSAISVAALLHDIGHIAPGSHAAQRAWFPQKGDSHEEIATRIIKNASSIREKVADDALLDTAIKILLEDPSLPPWTWEIISGSGWNVDRGNWCIVDSILAGVMYGQYNISALTDSLTITKDKHIAIRENRLDALMHFTLSRQAMYRMVYQHRVLLACDALTVNTVKRARVLIKEGSTVFADEVMQAALAATDSSELKLEDIFWMRESWFKYHLAKWSNSEDKILADLSDRLLHRRLFKTVRIQRYDDKEELKTNARRILSELGFDPEYYLAEIHTVDVNAADAVQSILVQKDDGRILPFNKSEHLYDSMLLESKNAINYWLAMPEEAKAKMGRAR